jgi:hypothetical protein
MRVSFGRRCLGVVTLAAVLLAACGQAASPTGSPTAEIFNPGAAPSTTATPPTSATATTAPSASQSPLPVSTQRPPATPSAGPAASRPALIPTLDTSKTSSATDIFVLSVTQADNGKTVTLPLGKALTLFLTAPPSYDLWQPSVPDARVLQPTPNPGAAAIAGATFTAYRAVGIGQTQLSATGRCQPAGCNAPLLTFAVTVRVVPASSP